MTCKLCHGLGFIPVTDEYGNQSLELCSCRKETEMLKSLDRAGLGKYAKDKNFKDFKTTQDWQDAIKQKCMDYSRKPKGWLTILGQSGSGKTHLGIATAKNIVALNTHKNFISRYVIWTDLMYEMDFGKIPIDRYNSLVSADLLYIDDFLKHKEIEDITPAEDKLAFAIINARDMQGKLTIITSEWFIQDLENYHFAIARRIEENSKDNLLQITRDRSRRYNHE